MISLHEEVLPSVLLNEAEWPAMENLSYKLYYKMSRTGWLRVIRKAFLSWAVYLMELYIHTPSRRSPKIHGTGEQKAMVHLGKLTLLACLHNIQGHQGETLDIQLWLRECRIIWYRQSSPRVGQMDNGLEFAPVLWSKGIKCLVPPQRVIMDLPLLVIQRVNNFLHSCWCGQRAPESFPWESQTLVWKANSSWYRI